MTRDRIGNFLVLIRLRNKAKNTKKSAPVESFQDNYSKRKENTTKAQHRRKFSGET